MSSVWQAISIALVVSSVVVLLVLGAIGAIRSAKRRPSGVGAVGWAMLFLTSGRMPPPPPASQIEEANRGDKHEGAVPKREEPPEDAQHEIER